MSKPRPCAGETVDGGHQASTKADSRPRFAPGALPWLVAARQNGYASGGQ